MSTWRKIDTKIWNDRKFMALSGDAKLAFFFILTHPAMTSLGGMRGTLEGLASELGSICLRHTVSHTVRHTARHTVSHTSSQADALNDGIFKPSKRDEFMDALDELMAAGLIECDPSACFICAPNFIKYNPPQSVNAAKGYAEAIEKIPECEGRNIMVKRVIALAEAMPYAFRYAIAHALAYALPQAIAHAKAMPRAMPRAIKEQEQEIDIGDTSSGDDARPSDSKSTHESIPESTPSKRKRTSETDWIMELWNERADESLPRCSVWAAKRKAAAAARIKEHPDRADWEAAIDAINASEFCLGQGERNWAATIDWLLKPDTIAKLGEGQFADREHKTPARGAHGQSRGNTGQHAPRGENVEPTPSSGGFWRHPDDPIPTDEDKARAGEWASIKAALAEEMEPDRFERFDDASVACEAVSDDALWLIVARTPLRASLRGFRDSPCFVGDLELFIAVNESLADQETEAQRASVS